MICMFTPSRAYCSKAGETKQMTEANNVIISLVFGTSRVSQSEGSVSVSCSGRSRPSDKGGGGGHPDHGIRGRASLQKIFFGPSGLNLVSIT